MKLCSRLGTDLHISIRRRYDQWPGAVHRNQCIDVPLIKLQQLQSDFWVPVLQCNDERGRALCALFVGSNTVRKILEISCESGMAGAQSQWSVCSLIALLLSMILCVTGTCNAVESSLNSHKFTFGNLLHHSARTRRRRTKNNNCNSSKTPSFLFLYLHRCLLSSTTF